MCKKLGNMLNNDLENVAQVLLDLEQRHGDALEDNLVSLLQLPLDIYTQPFSSLIQTCWM